MNSSAFLHISKDELVLMRYYSMFSIDDTAEGEVLSGAGNMFYAGADLDIGYGAKRGRRRKSI